MCGGSGGDDGGGGGGVHGRCSDASGVPGCMLELHRSAT